jgi:hypothetical protein
LQRYKKQTSEIEPTSHRSLDSIRKQRGKLKGSKLLRLNYLSLAATAAVNNKRRAATMARVQQTQLASFHQHQQPH